MNPTTSYRDFIVRQLAVGPRSVGELATAAATAGVKPTMNEGRTPDFNPRDQEDASNAHRTAADFMVSSLGCVPAEMSEEQQRAFVLRGKDGCMDDWPDGDARGYEVLDSIKYRLPMALMEEAP